MTPQDPVKVTIDIGGWYAWLHPAEFWGFHAVSAAGGGLLVIVLGRRLTAAFQP